MQIIPKFAYICLQFLFNICSKSNPRQRTMITVKACIYRHHRRSDGTYPVKLRITLGGTSRHLPTNYTATADQLTRSLKAKDPALAAALDELCASVRRSVAKLSPFAVQSMTVDDAVAFIKADQVAEAGIDFFTFADEVKARKVGGTLLNYTYAIHSLRKFAGPGPLDCRRITRRFVQEWVDQIVGDSAKLRYSQIVGTIFAQARLRYNDEVAGVYAIPQDPFRGLRLPRYIPKGQAPLDIATVQAMIDDRGCTINERRALDLFLISLCAQGAPLVDLYAMKAPQDGLLRYRRQKVPTSHPLTLFVEPPMAAMAARMRATRGGRWLDLAERYTDHRNAGTAINTQLARWCRRTGRPAFTYYAARHTWATLARSARVGADKALVDEALAHRGDNPMADIYAVRDPTRQWEVNRKVISLFDWAARM